MSDQLARYRRVLTASGTPATVVVTGPEKSGRVRVYSVQTEYGTFLVGGAGLVVSGTRAPLDNQPRNSRRDLDAMTQG